MAGSSVGRREKRFCLRGNELIDDDANVAK